jgi:hypothetical protein
MLPPRRHCTTSCINTSYHTVSISKCFLPSSLHHIVHHIAPHCSISKCFLLSRRFVIHRITSCNSLIVFRMFPPRRHCTTLHHIICTIPVHNRFLFQNASSSVVTAPYRASHHAPHCCQHFKMLSSVVTAPHRITSCTTLLAFQISFLLVVTITSHHIVHHSI